VEVKNSVMPNDTQIAGFFEQTTDGPIYMVNLLKFKEKASYEDGRKTDLTGREAYQIYGETVSKLLKEFGGGFMFAGNVQRLMLGEVEELWDEVAIAVYPSRSAMMEMMSSTKMQEIGQHRAAGLSGQLNIETLALGGEWLAGLT
jgi:uncharacterized protein (DUF1330 family)